MKLRPNSPHGVPVWRASRELFGRPKRSKTVPMWDYIAADNPRGGRMDEIFQRRGRPVDPAPMLGKPGKIPGPGQGS